MIGQIADLIGLLNINIVDMTNKSRDNIAINLIDLEIQVDLSLIDKIGSIEHVLKVRSLNADA
jgi:D-3-phosphoglycerate dehydrogenase